MNMLALQCELHDLPHGRTVVHHQDYWLLHLIEPPPPVRWDLICVGCPTAERVRRVAPLCSALRVGPRRSTPAGGGPQLFVELSGEGRPEGFALPSHPR